MKNSLIGGSTAAATGGLGLAQIIEMIPDNIGKLACLIGIIASIFVIRTQYSIIRKTELEIKKLRSGK